jgi:hypothetical protein
MISEPDANDQTSNEADDHRRHWTQAHARAPLRERRGSPVASARVLDEPDVSADDQSRRGDEQGDAKCGADHLLDRLPSPHPTRDEDAAECPGDRAQAQPLHQTKMNGTAA